MKHDTVTLLDWYQARYQAMPLSWISSSHLLIPSFPLESNKQKHIKKHIEWAKKQRKGQITPKENGNTKKIFANINQAIDLYLIRKYKLDLTFYIPVCEADQKGQMWDLQLPQEKNIPNSKEGYLLHQAFLKLIHFIHRSLQREQWGPKHW